MRWLYIKIAYVYVYIFLRCEEEYFCFGLLITYRSPAVMLLYYAFECALTLNVVGLTTHAREMMD